MNGPAESASLLIHVMHAEGLKKADTILQGGKADPYVKVYVGPALVFTTKSKSTTLNPDWDEIYRHSIDVSDPDWSSATVVFSLMDKDTVGSDDPLGEVQLPLKSTNGPLTLDVKDSAKSHGAKGTLTVALKLDVEYQPMLGLGSMFSSSDPEPQPQKEGASAGSAEQQMAVDTIEVMMAGGNEVDVALALLKNVFGEANVNRWENIFITLVYVQMCQALVPRGLIAAIDGKKDLLVGTLGYVKKAAMLRVPNSNARLALAMILSQAMWVAALAPVILLPVSFDVAKVAQTFALASLVAFLLCILSFGAQHIGASLAGLLLCVTYAAGEVYYAVTTIEDNGTSFFPILASVVYGVYAAMVLLSAYYAFIILKSGSFRSKLGSGLGGMGAELL